MIEEKVEEGLTAQRIYQDLLVENDFEGSYQSVKRFVRKLRDKTPGRVWRLECEPGEEGQIDFGLGAPVVDDRGRRRRTWVFRIVLSFSRKAYSEAVFHQDTRSLIRCLENAFLYFGGVPAILNPDNLKAAVLKADWFDPELNPMLEAFCRHYGAALVPSRPYRPQDKGKVESGIKYVKNNALKGRTFQSLQEQNAFLRKWEETVADKRIHGTTRKQVGSYFQSHEKTALKPLPATLFPCYKEELRKVQRDSYVTIEKALYHVPEEFIGRTVWARWDQRIVRILDRRMNLLITHVKLEPGKFTQVLGCGGRTESMGKNLAWWQARLRPIGSGCSKWVKEVIDQRGVQALRLLQGLESLSRKYPSDLLNTACERASETGKWRLSDIHALLQQQEPLPVPSFIDEHALIRPMEQYGRLVPFITEKNTTDYVSKSNSIFK